MAIVSEIPEGLVHGMKHVLNKKMEEAAEPLIQEALKDIEIKMRKEVASNLISIMENHTEFYMTGQTLVVKIGRAGNP